MDAGLWSEVAGGGVLDGDRAGGPGLAGPGGSFLGHKGPSVAVTRALFTCKLGQEWRITSSIGEKKAEQGFGNKAWKGTRITCIQPAAGWKNK